MELKEACAVFDASCRDFVERRKKFVYPLYVSSNAMVPSHVLFPADGNTLDNAS